MDDLAELFAAHTFRNHYECPCGETWSDTWTCIVDDDCPGCGTTCSPDESEDI